MMYRRVFIMRKDLNMSPGKLAAQVGHCAEAYWTGILRSGNKVPEDIMEWYVGGTFTKTICQARNKSHLMKAAQQAKELGLTEGDDYGLIFDACKTELIPEEEDGTTLTGIWFRPLPDELAHSISKKYHLYM